MLSIFAKINNLVPIYITKDSMKKPVIRKCNISADILGLNKSYVSLNNDLGISINTDNTFSVDIILGNETYRSYYNITKEDDLIMKCDLLFKKTKLLLPILSVVEVLENNNVKKIVILFNNYNSFLDIKPIIQSHNSIKTQIGPDCLAEVIPSKQKGIYNDNFLSNTLMKPDSLIAIEINLNTNNAGQNIVEFKFIFMSRYQIEVGVIVVLSGEVFNLPGLIDISHKNKDTYQITPHMAIKLGESNYIEIGVNQDNSDDITSIYNVFCETCRGNA